MSSVLIRNDVKLSSSLNPKRYKTKFFIRNDTKLDLYVVKL